MKKALREMQTLRAWWR